MMPLFRLKHIEGQYIARAIAILLIVANHAFPSINFSGGILVLLFISGFNLLKFSVGKTNSQLITYFLKFALKIAIPCFLISCFYFFLYQKAPLDEVFFFSNWLKTESIPWIPLWYPQMILQSMIIIAFFFGIFKPSAYLQNKPLLFSIISLVISIALAPLTYLLQQYEIATLAARLPFSYLWCLILGWFVFACQATLPRKSKNIFAIAACSAVAVIFIIPHEHLKIYITFPHQGMSCFIIFMPLVYLFIFNPRVLMPPPLVFIIKIIANATFTIF